MKPTMAESGRQALKALERSVAAGQLFPLVLTDVMMPGMDGLVNPKVATRFLEEMTAHAMKGDRERCLASGMDGYVSKPIRVQKLEEALSAVSPAIREPKLPPKQHAASEDPTRMEPEPGETGQDKSVSMAETNGLFDPEAALAGLGNNSNNSSQYYAAISTTGEFSYACKIRGLRPVTKDLTCRQFPWAADHAAVPCPAV